MDSVSRTPSDSSPAPVSTSSSPHAGLTDAECRRRAKLAKEATQAREQHALDKVDFNKRWKRRDEALAELIERLVREAADGVDEGGQLVIPGTEPEPALPVTRPEARPPWYPELTPMGLGPITLADLEAPEEAIALLAYLHQHEPADEDEPYLLTEQLLAEALPDEDESERVEAGLWLWATGYLVEADGKDPGVDRTSGPVKVRSPEDLARELLQVMPPAPAAATAAELQQALLLPREWLDALVDQLVRRGTLVKAGSPDTEAWSLNPRNLVAEAMVLRALAKAGGKLRHWQFHCTTLLDHEVELAVQVLHLEGALTWNEGWLQLVPERERKVLTAEQIDERVLKLAGTNGLHSAFYLAHYARLPREAVTASCERLCQAGQLEAVDQPDYAEPHEAPWFTRPKATKGDGKAKKKATKTKPKASRAKKATKPAPKAKPQPAKKAPAKPSPALAEAPTAPPADRPEPLAPWETVRLVLREDGELTTDQVCQRADLSRVEALGALERLLQRGLVSRSEEGGREFWLALEEAPAAAPVPSPELPDTPTLPAPPPPADTLPEPPDAPPPGLTDLSFLEGIWWRVDKRPRSREFLTLNFPHRSKDDVQEAIGLLVGAGLATVTPTVGKTEGEDRINGKPCRGGESCVVDTVLRDVVALLATNDPDGAGMEAHHLAVLLGVREGTAWALMKAAQKEGYVDCEAGHVWRKARERAEAAE